MILKSWSPCIPIPSIRFTSLNNYNEPDTIYFKSCMMLISLNISKALKFFPPNQRYSGNWDERGAGRRGRKNSHLSWAYSLTVLEIKVTDSETRDSWRKEVFAREEMSCKHATSSLPHLSRWVFFSLSQWCHYQVILKFFFNEGVLVTLCILNLGIEFVLPIECHFKVGGPRTASFSLIWWLTIFSTSIGRGRVEKAGKLRVWG